MTRTNELLDLDVEEDYFDTELYEGDRIPTPDMLTQARGFDVRLLFQPRSKYTIEKKIEVAALYLQTGSSIKTGKATGVPASTIREWKMKAVWWDDTLERCRLALDEKIAASLTQALDEGARKILLQVKEGVEVHVETQEWSETIKPPTNEDGSPGEGKPKTVIRKRKIYEKQDLQGTQLATMFGITYDKLALMRGRPTSRVENTDNSDKNILSIVEDRLQKAFEEKEVKVISQQDGEGNETSKK